MSKLLVFRYRGIAVLCCAVCLSLLLLSVFGDIENARLKFVFRPAKALVVAAICWCGGGILNQRVIEKPKRWKKKERKNVTTYKINKQPRLKFIGVICSKFLNKIIFLCQVWWYFFWNNHIFNHISSEFLQLFLSSVLCMHWSVVACRRRARRLSEQKRIIS